MFSAFKECAERCQRTVSVAGLTTTRWIRYREMDLQPPMSKQGSQITVDVGKSCELNSPLRVFTSHIVGDYKSVTLTNSKWKEGVHEVPQTEGNIKLHLSDRSDICSFLGEDNASTLVIIAISFVVVFISYIIYLKARTYMYDIDEYIRIEKGLCIVSVLATNV